MAEFTPLRDYKRTSPYKQGDVFVLFGELFSRGYANGLVENAKKGWTWFQNKKVDGDDKPNWYIYYHWKVYNEKGKEEGSCVHNTESVLKSGDWEKVDNKKKKGYYQWIYKL